jgi:hypothetical protein
MNSVQFCKFPVGFPVEQVVFAGFLLLVDAPFLSFEKSNLYVWVYERLYLSWLLLLMFIIAG